MASMSSALVLLLLLRAPGVGVASAAGDRSRDRDTCAVVEGGGCDCGEHRKLDCERSATGRPDSRDSEDSATLEGGGHGCATARGAGLLAALVSLLALSRRRAAPLILALLLVRQARAADAQELQDVDGGTFLSLQEPRWSDGMAWRASLASGYARAPVVWRSNTGETPYIDGVATLEPALALDLGGWFQVGVVWPQHLAWIQAEDGIYVPGDLGLRVGIPLRAPDDGSLAMTWAVQADLKRGGDMVMLGDQGAVKGTLALGRELGAFRTAANVGVRLQDPEELPGSTWGNRLELGLGLSRETFSNLDASLELYAGAPLSLAAIVPATLPLEALGGLRYRGRRGRALRLAVGVGLSRGVGAPEYRLVLAADATGALADHDQDGLVDIRDLCPLRPEDLDRHRDADGCPDPDNDRDGFPDVADACPDEAEVSNGYQDDDGCPDAASLLRLRVDSPLGAPFEQATVTVGDLPAQQVLAEEWLEHLLPAGPVKVRATADGFWPAEAICAVPDQGTLEQVLTLSPIKTGELRLRLVEPSGAALDGTVEIEGVAHPVPGEGLVLSLPTGSLTALATAPQHAPARGEIEVQFRRRVELTLTLAPVAVDRADGHVTLSGEVGFTLDHADLRPEDLPLLDALADWLGQHPDVHLLRVEGHADEPGTPQYNYGLSLRRASAVQDYLVSRGVAPERLQAVGDGEAIHTRDAQGATRRVDFLILIWDEPLPP